FPGGEMGARSREDSVRTPTPPDPRPPAGPRAVGAIGGDEAEMLAGRGFDALGALVGVVEDPARRFLELLGSQLAALGCHVTDPFGRPPGDDPQWWGWRVPATPASYADPMPMGRHVGWLRGDIVWLDPDEAHRAVCELARGIGEQVASARVVWRALGRAGLISREPARESWKVRAHDRRPDSAGDGAPGGAGAPARLRGWPGPSRRSRRPEEVHDMTNRERTQAHDDALDELLGAEVPRIGNLTADPVVRRGEA